MRMTDEARAHLRSALRSSGEHGISSIRRWQGRTCDPSISSSRYNLTMRAVIRDANRSGWRCAGHRTPSLGCPCRFLYDVAVEAAAAAGFGTTSGFSVLGSRRLASACSFGRCSIRRCGCRGRGSFPGGHCTQRLGNVSACKRTGSRVRRGGSSCGTVVIVARGILPGGCHRRQLRPSWASLGARRRSHVVALGRGCVTVW